MNAISIATTEIRQLDGLYSLNDLQKASGGSPNHAPAQFLRLAQTKALITEISRCADSHIINSNIAFKKVRGRGKLQGTYACKELVYAYAMWISPQFTLEVIRTFDALKTSPAAATQETPSLINRRWLISYNYLGQEQVHAVPADACVMTADEFVNALLDPAGISLSTEQQAALIATMAQRLANKTAFYQAKAAGKRTKAKKLNVISQTHFLGEPQ